MALLSSSADMEHLSVSEQCAHARSPYNSAGGSLSWYNSGLHSADTHDDNTVPEGTAQHVYAMYKEPETSQG
jgi:hypothetical protein